MTNILIFEVMVMDDNILLKTIEKHNQAFNTDFEVIKIDYDEAIFCTIQVSKYTYADLFNLGHHLSIVEHLMRECGETDW